MRREGIHIRTICNCISLIENNEYLDGIFCKKIIKNIKAAHVNDVEYKRSLDHYFLTNGSYLFPLYKENVFDIGNSYIADLICGGIE